MWNTTMEDNTNKGAMVVVNPCNKGTERVISVLFDESLAVGWMKIVYRQAALGYVDNDRHTDSISQRQREAGQLLTP